MILLILKKRDKVKEFNCIDEYNKYMHQIEDQIKIETKERQKREKEVADIGFEKKDIELEFSKFSFFLQSIIKQLI